jgi:hypothetical protein
MTAQISSLLQERDAKIANIKLARDRRCAIDPLPRPDTRRGNPRGSSVRDRVSNFEQTARAHPDIMKSGKQTCRTGRFCATGLNAAVRMPPPRVWTVAMFA